jgi:hypothetical protein
MYPKASAELIRSLSIYKESLGRGGIKNVALMTNTDQSQVSRILSGEFLSITPVVKKICKYANISTKKSPKKNNTAILNVIDEVWDGGEELEELLINILRSIKPLAKRLSNVD